MTALQLNADIYRNLAVIAEDESVLARVGKYLRRVAKQMTDDPTCMTKEEFYARVAEAAKGPSRAFDSAEELDRYIRNL